MIKKFCLSFGILVLFGLVSFQKTANGESPSEIAITSLTADESKICVQLSDEPPSDAVFVRCRPEEYHPATAFLSRFDGIGDDCSDDGYETDRAYYRPDDVRCCVEAVAPVGRTFEIDRFSKNALDSGRDKIFDKFYLVQNGTIENDRLQGGSILAGPRYVTDFPSLRTDRRVEKKSIKGLEVRDVEDAKELGVAHAAITVDLCSFFANETDPKLEFFCDGKPFYFNERVVADYDRRIKAETEADMEITLVLIFWGHRISLAPPDAIHPDFEVWLEAPGTLSIAAPNLTSCESVDRWRALFEFLGERYTKKDGEFGLVSNFVVGNELNSGYIWNNMGRTPLDETVRQYERGLRIASTALRKYWSDVRVLASFDNYWNSDSATEFGQTRFIQKGGFCGKDYLIALNELTKTEGDYPWTVAYHPYGLDLRTPIYWDERSVREAPLDENARRLTPLNIEILPQFLDRPEMRYRGIRRDFYFTEQGFASPHEDDYIYYNAERYEPDAIPQKWLDLQAAAYAFAHYKFVAVGAKADIFHRHFDVRGELLNIGLWTRPKDKDGGYCSKKPIYELFRQIDGERSLDVSTPYLKLLTIYPNQEPPRSWEEIVPGFDAVRASFLKKNESLERSTQRPEENQTK